jgi:lysophospholipase L1-like esterase
MIKREWLVLVAVVTATLIVSLGLIRWFAPQLLGIPVDLQSVRVGKTLPPFFEGVFRREDFATSEMILSDPYTRVRNRPLLPESFGIGPHDILGFRNYDVPNVADVVTIGDSQTYGNNVALEENWPSRLEAALNPRRSRVYSMAVGGWSAVQYMDMFTNATLFQPRVVVVAFYTGNDSLEAFKMAYSVDRWKGLRLDPDLTGGDLPKSPGFPPPDSELWEATRNGGDKITFSPSLRLISNDTSHPAAKAGYDIIAEAARQISRTAAPVRLPLLYTIIPTKELVYSRRIRAEDIESPPVYESLIELEGKNIDWLRESFSTLDNVQYVDVVTPLQEAAMTDHTLYPPNMNGHPLAPGYRVIGEAIAAAARTFLPSQPPRGLVATQVGEKQFLLYLVNEEGRWLFASSELAALNGWDLDNMPVVPRRDLARVPVRGTVVTVDPERFGPGRSRQ